MTQRSPLVSSIVVGGIAAAILDGIDAIAAFGLVLHLDPVTIYQFVASGLLGPSAYQGGLATALVGLAVHFTVALSAAAVYSLAARRYSSLLLERFALAGTLYGIGVYFFMSYVVIPLSAIPPSPFSVPLFVNGIVGHALFVGLPVAWAARHFLVGQHGNASLLHPSTANAG